MSHLISILFGLACIVCSLIIWIDAFKNSLLKGLLCVFCWIYFVWYALFEFQHDNKFLIVLGALICGGLTWLTR